jgi:hypothetical protein
MPVWWNAREESGAVEKGHNHKGQGDCVKAKHQIQLHHRLDEIFLHKYAPPSTCTITANTICQILFFERIFRCRTLAARLIFESIASGYGDRWRWAFVAASPILKRNSQMSNFFFY